MSTAYIYRNINNGTYYVEDKKTFDINNNDNFIIWEYKYDEPFELKQTKLEGILLRQEKIDKVMKELIETRRYFV